jgi:hypothetical protein
VSRTLQGFDELTENEKDELFENYIQAYVQYPEELKQKGNKVAMKIISHAWRSYKTKLVKLWRKKDSSFCTYKELREEDWMIFVEKCESENFVTNSQYMQWLRSQNKLDHNLNNTGYAGNRGSGNKRMKHWLNKFLRIHMTNSVNGWHHLYVLVLS